MALNSGPPSLQDILYCKIARTILTNFPRTHQEIKEFYRSIDSVRRYFRVLPWTVFGELTKTAFNRNRKYFSDTLNFSPSVHSDYPSQLYLYEIFLQGHIRSVYINLSSFKSPAYFSRLMALIRENNSNLSCISIKTNSYQIVHPITEDYQHLHAMIISGTKLSKLSLCGICTDEILRVIGVKCINLSKLDISYSHVTDVGLNLLTQSISEVQQYAEELDDNDQWESALWQIPQIFPVITELLPLNELILQDKRYSRSKNGICYQLRKLNILHTKVSFRGILVILELLPQLEDLGYQLDDFLVYLNYVHWNGFSDPSQLKLKKLQVMCLTNQKLSLVKYLFPLIRDLKFHFIEENVRYSDLPHVECLSVQGGVVAEGQLNIFNQFLLNRGHNLRSLYLCLSPGFITDFNISILLPKCSNLTHLTIRYLLRPLHMIEQEVQQINVTVINIDSFVTENTLLNFLKWAPNIEQLFVGYLRSRTETFVDKICEVAPRSKLNTLWVNNGRFLESEAELSAFLQAFQNIKILGELPPSLHTFDLEIIKDKEKYFLTSFQIHHDVHDVQQIIQDFDLNLIFP